MKKNPQDSTLRNVRAINKRVAALSAEFRVFKRLVKELDRRVRKGERELHEPGCRS